MAKTPTPAIPSNAALSARDLSDEEFVELDELLADTPEPLQPLDVVMLDGYLCGVLVQPVLLTEADWLPAVFDFDSRPLPPGHDPAWLARCTGLILRRHAALNRAMVEDGWFDPLVLEDDEEGSAEAAALPEAPEDASGDPMAGLSAVSRPLMPWVAGFHHAIGTFPALADMPDEAVSLALARLFRHLPAETDDERETVATLDREFPLASVEEALEELVVTVADLSDLTRDARYHVDTVQRSSPKLGRNDPCHCGSGKKFKQCHGKA
jgi:uncharacterized protein